MFLDDNNVKVIRVSSTTSVTALTGSILNALKDSNSVELRAMGAGALNQMYKSLAKANIAISAKGLILFIRPGFDTVFEEKNGEKLEKTVLIARIVLRSC